MKSEVKEMADFILKTNGMTRESFLEAGDDVKKSMNNIINSISRGLQKNAYLCGGWGRGRDA